MHKQNCFCSSAPPYFVCSENSSNKAYLLLGLKYINHTDIVWLYALQLLYTPPSFPQRATPTHSSEFVCRELMSKPDVGPARMKAFTDTVFLSQPYGCTHSLFVIYFLHYNWGNGIFSHCLCANILSKLLFLFPPTLQTEWTLTCCVFLLLLIT